MEFLQPTWLLTLLVIPVLIGVAVLMQFRGSKKWKALVAERHISALSYRQKQVRDWVALGFAMITVACTAFALARPYTGKRVETEKIESRNVVLLIDVSKSMHAQDVSPDRLTIAKTFSMKLLKALRNDRVGVMTFAGNTAMLAPMTIDHDALRDSIAMLEVDQFRKGGSKLSGGVIKCMDKIKKSGQRSSAIIVISDGEEHDVETEVAINQAKEDGIIICCVGVGTKAGSTIPEKSEPDGKFRDRNNNVVHTRLNEGLLRQLATATKGAYTNASSNNDVGIQLALRSMEKFEQDNRQEVVPNEQYQWFILPAVLALFSSILTRTRWGAFQMTKQNLTKTATTSIVLIIGSVILAPAPVQADESLLSRGKRKFIDEDNHLRDGIAALERKEYEAASRSLNKAATTATGERLARIKFTLGEIYYRTKLYPQATHEFAHALLSKEPSTQAHASHNIGNSLFHPMWDKLKPTDDRDFKTYITESIVAHHNGDIKKLPFTQNNIDQAEVQWKDSIKYYSLAHKTISPFSEAKDNEATVTQLLEDLKDAQIEAKEEIKRQEEEKNKQQQKDKKKDPSDCDQGDDPSDNKGDKGDKPKDKDQGEPKDKKNGEPNDKKQDGDPKDKDDSQKEPSDQKGDTPPKDAKGDEKLDGKQKPSDEVQDREQKDISTKELKEQLKKEQQKKETALQKLENYSDLQQKPSGKWQRTRYLRPHKDW